MGIQNQNYTISSAKQQWKHKKLQKMKINKKLNKEKLHKKISKTKQFI